MPQGELDSLVALVTGAGSGIGRGVVERFLDEGAHVVAFDRSAERLEQLSAELGDGIECVTGDVRSPEDNERAVSTAVERFGGLDVLVGNAGVFDAELGVEDIDGATLKQAADEIFGVNVVGYLLAAQAAAPQLRERHGSIVFTVSNAGFHPGAGGGILYTVSKHAAVGVVRQLAFELAPDVRVNGVAPGGTVTGLAIASSLQAAAGTDLHFTDPARSAQRISETNPLRIAATPADHAGLYVLLASPATRAVTGEIVSSDGGLAVRGLASGGGR